MKNITVSHSDVAAFRKLDKDGKNKWLNDEAHRHQQSVMLRSPSGGAPLGRLIVPEYDKARSAALKANASQGQMIQASSRRRSKIVAHAPPVRRGKSRIVGGPPPVGTPAANANKNQMQRSGVPMGTKPGSTAKAPSSDVARLENENAKLQEELRLARMTPEERELEQTKLAEEAAAAPALSPGRQALADAQALVDAEEAAAAAPEPAGEALENAAVHDMGDDDADDEDGPPPEWEGEVMHSRIIANPVAEAAKADAAAAEATPATAETPAPAVAVVPAAEAATPAAAAETPPPAVEVPVAVVPAAEAAPATETDAEAAPDTQDPAATAPTAGEPDGAVAPGSGGATAGG